MKIKRKNKYDKIIDILTDKLERNTDKMHSDNILKDKVISALKQQKNRKSNIDFKIHIVYSGNADKNMAMSLRITLNKNGNVVTISDFESYKTTVSEIPDYYIFINHPKDELPNDMYKILNEYGYEISISGRYIHLNYNEHYFDEKDITAFIDHYFEKLDKAKANDSRLKDECKKFKSRNSVLTNGKLLPKLAETIENFWDKLYYSDMPTWLSRALVIASLPIFAVIGISFFPVDISIISAETIYIELQNNSFNKTYIKEMQQQILMVEIIEYIAKLQLGKLLNPEN